MKSANRVITSWNDECSNPEYVRLSKSSRIMEEIFQNPKIALFEVFFSCISAQVKVGVYPQKQKCFSRTKSDLPPKLPGG